MLGVLLSERVVRVWCELGVNGKRVYKEAN